MRLKRLLFRQCEMGLWVVKWMLPLELFLLAQA
jgi:hypothetical protein